jgi:nucleotide-binding universal stress UspA family protein
MRVLLATDGSEDARAATAWLTRFPLPGGSRVRVVTVVSIPPSGVDMPTVRDLVGTLRQEAGRTAEAAKSAVAARFADAEARVLGGEAREAILRAAEEWPADLIVLGARGLGAVAGFLLGSVSLGVARHARCSVLVVKGGTGELRGVLVALDGSEHAAAAASFLAKLPLDPSFVIRLVSVVEVPPYPATTPAFASGMVRQGIKDIVKERRAALEQAQSAAAAAFAGRVKKVEREVVSGHPVDALTGAASKPGVDLVVVGARGLGTLKRLVLGSVSEDVLRHVDRPVLIVKTGEPADRP